MKEITEQLSEILQDHIVVMQTAWLEWRYGKGAEAAMQWIENTLDGPGHIPEKSEEFANEPQMYFNANRAKPFPRCVCGRPSHIVWMGQGFCSNIHYAEAKAKTKA